MDVQNHHRTHRPRQSPWFSILVAALGAVLVLGAGCSADSSLGYPAPSGGSAANGPTAPGPYGGSYAGGTATGDTEAGAAFARWVLEQDPRHEYMTDAVVRDEQTLGVKVQPNVTKRDLQQLLGSLVEGMAQTFPGKPVRVIAYYQSGDKLAEADRDPRTGRVEFR
jgi:hypothetical protein